MTLVTTPSMAPSLPLQGGLLSTVSPDIALAGYAEMVAGEGADVSVLYLSTNSVLAVHRAADGRTQTMTPPDESRLQTDLLARTLLALDMDAGSSECLQILAAYSLAVYSASHESVPDGFHGQATASAISRELLRQIRRAPEVTGALSNLAGGEVILCGPLVGASPPACSPEQLAARLLPDKRLVGASRWSPWALSAGSAWCHRHERSSVR